MIACSAFVCYAVFGMSAAHANSSAQGDANHTRASLLSRVRDGADPKAWGEFESRYRELLYRYCRRRGLQHADAEDCAQAVLVNMVRSMPRFVYDPKRGRFRDYLHRCAKNLIVRMNQRPAGAAARLELDVDTLMESNNIADEHEQTWEDEWVAHHMRRAFDVVRAQVEVRSLQIFEACLAGLETADVAREFGVTVDAVHKTKQRVRDKLQAQIAMQIAEEEGAHG